jgi:hypothetical protein
VKEIKSLKESTYEYTEALIALSLQIGIAEIRARKRSTPRRNIPWEISKDNDM